MWWSNSTGRATCRNSTSQMKDWLKESYRNSYVRRFLLIFTNSTTCLVDFWMFLSISLRLCNARFGSSPCLTVWGFCTLHPGVQRIPTTCSGPWRQIVASRPPRWLEKHGAGQIYPAGSFPAKLHESCKHHVFFEIGLSTFFLLFSHCWFWSCTGYLEAVFWDEKGDGASESCKAQRGSKLTDWRHVDLQTRNMFLEMNVDFCVSIFRCYNSESRTLSNSDHSLRWEYFSPPCSFAGLCCGSVHEGSAAKIFQWKWNKKVFETRIQERNPAWYRKY